MRKGNMAHEQDASLPSVLPSDQGASASDPLPLASVPAPSPARFIRHPPRNGTSKPVLSDPSAPATTNSTTITNNDHHDLTTFDITDSIPRSGTFSNSSEDAGDGAENLESQSLLLLEKHSSSHSISPKPSISSTSTLVGPSSHNPIPATQVFARNTLPLHLPKLDAYLASLPKPPFSGEKTYPKPRMFPPMDKLANSNQSLEDMEMNSKIPPFWRNRKTLLGAAVSLFMGLTVSNTQSICVALSTKHRNSGIQRYCYLLQSPGSC